MAGKARLALFSDRHVVSQHTEPPGPPPSHRYHHLQGAGPTDRTQIVRVYDSQSCLLSTQRCCGRRHQKRPQAMRASGSPEALGSSINLASHFNQAWSRPHKGQLETGSLSGRAAKLWGSISIPVETSRPLSGHLTLRTPIVCPPFGLRELCSPLLNYWSARH